MKESKNIFSGRVGFILAAAGSAVGLGNIWRFPYLAAKHGGGIFLLVYLILAVTFGFALMITEISIGRKTGKSALYAFSTLNKKYGFIGVLASLVPMIIFPYYCVIGGWVIKYLIVFFSNQGMAATSDTFFNNFVGQTGEPIVWLIVFMIASMLIVMMGVQNGIEKASKVLMPLLVILSVFIAGYTLTVDGAIDGLIYYIKPDFSKFTANTLLAAMGQLFYSMSLAMGIMITYGSYLPKKEGIEPSVRNIELFDTGIAFVSGLIIIPSVFAFSGGDESVLSSGPGLMFVTLPKVFESMRFGEIIGAVFFVLVLFAALTSSISILETIVSIVQDKFKLKRITSCLCIVGISIIISILCSLGFGSLSHIAPLNMTILDFFDFVSNSLLMPIVALATCIFVGYIIKPKVIADEVKSSGTFKSERLYNVLIKYIAPILILLILISSILNAFGIITL